MRFLFKLTKFAKQFKTNLFLQCLLGSGRLSQQYGFRLAKSIIHDREKYLFDQEGTPY